MLLSKVVLLSFAAISTAGLMGLTNSRGTGFITLFLTIIIMIEAFRWFGRGYKPQPA